MPHPLRASRRSTQRGATLLEALIVLTFFGVVGSIVTLAVSSKARGKAKAAIGFADPPPPKAPKHADLAAIERSSSELGAILLRSTARRWLDGRAESACPSIEDLIDDSAADPARQRHDAWGGAFEISCEGDEVQIHSAGPDRVRGTADDIVEPKPG